MPFILTTLFVWALSFLIATVVLEQEPQSAALRGAMVALAMVGLVVWIVSTVRQIRSDDEFTQHIHLVALAWAFAGTGVFISAADFLSRAGFIGDVPMLYVWGVMVLTWWVSMMLTARYYR